MTMNGLMTLEGKALAHVELGSLGSVLPAPFKSTIYLFKTTLVGTMALHVGTLVNVKSGDRLTAYHDVDNAYNEFSVVFKDQEGNRVGFLPEINAEIVTHLLDGGKVLYGIVTKAIPATYGGYRIEVKVSMEG